MCATCMKREALEEIQQELEQEQAEEGREEAVALVIKPTITVDDEAMYGIQEVDEEEEEDDDYEKSDGLSF